jgi:hypothetical protein
MLIFPKQTYAADYGLSISPPLLRVHIKPGKSITQVFRLENLSKSEKTLVAGIVPFTDADELGNPILNPKANTPWISYFSLANSSITLDKPFTIKSGSSEQLILSLSVPESAPSRDIYATLLIATYNNTIDDDFMGTSVSGIIGANLLITVNSQAFPDTILRIEDFKPQQGSFLKIGNIYLADSISPLTFSAVVNNQGNYIAETKGVFRVTTRNKPIHLEGILPVNVIGNSRRQLLNTNGDAFEYSPSLTNTGLHRLSLEIQTDNSSTTGSIEIFFFPLKLTIGLIIALLLIATTVKFTTKTPPKTY